MDRPRTVAALAMGNRIANNCVDFNNNKTRPYVDATEVPGRIVVLRSDPEGSVEDERYFFVFANSDSTYELEYYEGTLCIFTLTFTEDASAKAMRHIVSILNRDA